MWAVNLGSCRHMLGKNIRTYRIGRRVGPRTGLDNLNRLKTFFFLSGIELRTVQPIAYRKRSVVFTLMKALVSTLIHSVVFNQLYKHTLFPTFIHQQILKLHIILTKHFFLSFKRYIFRRPSSSSSDVLYKYSKPRRNVVLYIRYVNYYKYVLQ